MRGDQAEEKQRVAGAGRDADRRLDKGGYVFHVDVVIVIVVGIAIVVFGIGVVSVDRSDL